MQNNKFYKTIKYFYYPDLQYPKYDTTILNCNVSEYDAIGNLVTDVGENMEIKWNLAGKVAAINRLNDNVALYFGYSPTGQRQCKTSVRNGEKTTTWYIHDASGNVMAVYEQHPDTLTLKERTLYGSRRLGLELSQIQYSLKRDAAGCPHLSVSYLDGDCTIGTRRYELTDHLGNVTATLSDRKLCKDTNNNGMVDAYIPELYGITDYYPFGFPIKERSYTLNDYRYGFNGQESDGEVYGEKRMSGYEFRQYDTRLGRWWGIDRLEAKYPYLSPYVFCANSPIRCVDVDGKEIVDANGKICYTTKDGWLPNATEETKRIGNAMMKTITGLEQFNRMVNSDTKIKFTLSSEIEGDGIESLVFGKMKPGKAYEDPKGNILLESAEIVIYEGSINAYYEGTTPFNIYSDYSIESAWAMNVSKDDYIAAVMSHEAEHVVSADNLKLNHIESDKIEIMPQLKKDCVLFQSALNKNKK